MEENRKGSTLYVVLGVATLIVAIIGATFAYFSAQASTNQGDISGGTSDVGAALSLTVTRDLVETTGDQGTVNYSNLVPAEISNTTDIKNAIDNKCIGTSGYVGCHVYKIEASSTEALTSASIRLADLQTTATDTASWKFYLYKLEADGTVTLIEDAKNADHSFAAYKDGTYTYVEGTPGGFDMHNGAALNEKVTYYLMIYLENKDNSQNPTDTTSTESGTGTYSGVVTMDAAGGKVYAKFEAKVGD